MSLVEDLIKQGYLRTPKIIKAFRSINRSDFVLPEDLKYAKENTPLSIGHEQTISQPLTVAFMMELLAPRAGDKILDVGSGSGWTVALLADIVGAKGKVRGIERISDLVHFGKSNLKKYNFINKGIASIRKGDGYKGLPEFAPFDKIIVAASGSKIPVALKDQLKIGGRLVMPIGDQFQSQDIVALTRNTASDFSAIRYPGFIFVPLINEK